MKHLQSIFIPSFLFFLSLLMRIALISKGPHHSDNLNFAVQAKNIVETGAMHYLHGSGSPLTALIGASFVTFLGPQGLSDPVFAVNLMSCVMGAVAVGLFYFLILSLFDRLSALIGAAFLSLNPVFWAVTTFGNSHALSLSCFFTALLSAKAFHSTKRFTFLIVSGIFFGFMCASRLQDAVLMILPFIAFWLLFGIAAAQSRKQPFSFTKETGNVLICFLIAGIAQGLFYIPLLTTQSSVGGQFGYHSQYILDSLKLIFESNLAIFPLYVSYFTKTFTPFGCTILIAALIYVVLKSPAKGGCLVLWFLFPFLFYNSLPTSVPRFYLIAFIPLIMCLASLLSDFFRKRRLFQTAAFLATAILVWGQVSFILPIIQFRHDHAVLPDYYRWVGKITEPHALIIESDNYLFTSFYADRSVIQPPISMFGLDAGEMDTFITTLQTNLSNGVPVYITQSGLMAHPPESHFPNIIRHFFRLEKVGSNYMEGWHQGTLKLQVGMNDLYQVYLK